MWRLRAPSASALGAEAPCHPLLDCSNVILSHPDLSTLRQEMEEGASDGEDYCATLQQMDFFCNLCDADFSVGGEMWSCENCSWCLPPLPSAPRQRDPLSRVAG